MRIKIQLHRWVRKTGKLHSIKSKVILPLNFQVISVSKLFHPFTAHVVLLTATMKQSDRAPTPKKREN